MLYRVRWKFIDGEEFSEEYHDPPLDILYDLGLIADELELLHYEIISSPLSGKEIVDNLIETDVFVTISNERE